MEPGPKQRYPRINVCVLISLPVVSIPKARRVEVDYSPHAFQNEKFIHALLMDLPCPFIKLNSL